MRQQTRPLKEPAEKVVQSHGADGRRQIIQRQRSKLFSDAGCSALKGKQRTSFGQLPVTPPGSTLSPAPPCDRRSLD